MPFQGLSSATVRSKKKRDKYDKAATSKTSPCTQGAKISDKRVTHLELLEFSAMGHGEGVVIRRKAERQPAHEAVHQLSELWEF